MNHSIIPYIETFKNLIDKGAIKFYTDEYESNDVTEDLVNGKININDINSILIDWLYREGVYSKDMKKPRSQIVKFGFKHTRYGSFKRNEYFIKRDEYLESINPFKNR